MKKMLCLKGIKLIYLVSSILFVFTGCMSIRNSDEIGTKILSKEQFNGKTIAVLPVRATAAQSTDSVLSLRIALNEKLDSKFKMILPNATILTTTISVKTLSGNKKLDIVDNLIKTYESMGVLDKNLLDSLFTTLNCDYIVFSKLNAEKKDFSFLAKGFMASLEILVIDKTKKEIVWGGTGDFKKGGIYGFGATAAKESASELVNIAMSKF